VGTAWYDAVRSILQQFTIITIPLSRIVSERLTGDKSHSFKTPPVFEAPLVVIRSEIMYGLIHN